MSRRVAVTSICIVLCSIALLMSGCGTKPEKVETEKIPRVEPDFSVVDDPVPGTKLFALSLTDGVLNYSDLNLAAGDAYRITLQYDGAPVDFKIRESDARSTGGSYFAKINPDNPGGTYHLECLARQCGSVAVVITNENAPVDSAAEYGITSVVIQRVPLGAVFSPGMQLQESAVFSVGDQMGIAMSGTFQEGDAYAYQFFGPDGSAIGDPSEPIPLKTGDNGSCCFSVPEIPGSYALKFFMNGTEAKTAIVDVQP